MTGLQTNIGLFSGINYVELVEQLLQLDGIPKTNLENRTAVIDAQFNAIFSMNLKFTRITSLLNNLNRMTPFLRTDVTSSNTSLLTVAKSGNPVEGNYTFTTLQMAASQQTVASGVASSTDALGKTGTITIGKGWTVDNSIELKDLNGGQGVSKGSFRITDGSGTRVTIDIRKATTINDVVNLINDNDDIDVIAELDGDRIVLKDVSGGDLNKFTVSEVSGGSTAASLGLMAGQGAAYDDATGVLTGKTIWHLGETMSLDLLNDGNGVLFDSMYEELFIYCKDGSKVIIGFNKMITGPDGESRNAKELTVGDLLNTINNQSNGKITAKISDDGKGITLTDNTQGSNLTSIDQEALVNPAFLRMLGLCDTDFNLGSPKIDMFTDYYKGAPAKMTVTDGYGETFDIELTVADIIVIREPLFGVANNMAAVAARLNDKLEKAGATVEIQQNNAGNGFIVIDKSDPNNGGGGAIEFLDGEDSDLATRLGLTNLAGTDLLSSLQDVGMPETIRFTDKDGNWVDIEITQADLDAAMSSNDNDITLGALIDLFNDKLTDASALVAGSLFAVEPGDITFTDSDGDSVTISIDQAEIDALTSPDDIASLLNGKIGTSAGIVFAVNSSGSLVMTDAGGGTEPIKVESDAPNGLAEFLGIEGEFEETHQVTGRALRPMEFDPAAKVEIEVKLNATGDGILIVDTTTSGSAGLLSVNRQGVALEDVVNSLTYRLGINLSSTTDEIEGRSFGVLYNSGIAQNGTFTTRNLIGGLDTTLVSTLNGGSGINKAKPGAIEVQDRAGNSATLTFSQTELNSMNTLTDTMKLFNAKLADAGVGITVKLNETKTALEVVDTTGKGTHNLIFKDQTVITAVPAVPGVDAVSGSIPPREAVSAGWNSSGSVVHPGLGGLAWLSFGNTDKMNGFTFGFTENPTESGYDAGSKTINFLLDAAAKQDVEDALAAADFDEANDIILASLNAQMADMWEDIYPPSQYGAIPPVEVSYVSGTKDIFAGYVLADAISGDKTAIRQDVTYSALGNAEGTASLTFEGTSWMNNFTFGFTTRETSAGYNASAQKFTIFLSADIMTETDPAEQDRLVKEAIDAQIAAIWADEDGGLPSFFRENGASGQIKMTDGLGANAILDALTGGETSIKSSVTGSVMGADPIPAKPDIVYSSNIASSFGLNVDSSSSRVSGTSLNRQIISYNTPLSTLNGGQGVNMTNGNIVVRDSLGNSQTLSVNDKQFKTVGDLLEYVNSRMTSVAVIARINERGDGITFDEYGGGTGSFSIADASSTSKFAETLGIAQTIPQSQKDEDGRLRINIAETHRIEVGETDSLEDIKKKINDLNLGYSASILNDGSNAPYRLSLASKQTGVASAFNVDLSAIGLTTDTMNEAKDAKIMYGDGSASNGLVLSSSTNTFSNVIENMTFTVTGVSDTPVTITSTSSSTDVKAALRLFITQYNEFREQLNKDLFFEVSGSKGVQGNVLWNDPVARAFDREMTAMLSKTINGIPGVRTLADLGITTKRSLETTVTTNSDGKDEAEGEYVDLGLDLGKLYFDEDKFQQAWDRDKEAVQKFFYNEKEVYDPKTGETTTTSTGWVQAFMDLSDKLIGSSDGAITGKAQNHMDTLQLQITRNEERIAFMEERLEFKRQMYMRSFFNMEQALAKMSADSSSIASIMSSWSSNYSSGG